MLEKLDAAIAAYRARTGELPPSVAALVASGDLAQIPPDPFGGSFEIDPETGAARSSTGKTPSRLHTSRFREKALAGKTGSAWKTREDRLDDAWMVAWGPLPAPRLVAAVLVEDAGEGGKIAGPIAVEMLRRAGERLDARP